ncbi:hypothetical protein IAR50_000320 [Cryptococcus sp. DSM 104548]
MPWLMKAEPDSRIVKGKDVKFSVDDFEKIGVSPWDGVRNHEAKKIMKELMKKGDKVLFYHSNCKTPGVFAVAEVVKEGFPDYTAWDPTHPYYDPKSSKESPTWYMVEVKFHHRLAHPPTLALIKNIAAQSNLPSETAYIGQEGLDAIKAMALVNRGRLSVQPVEDTAYEAIVKLGTQGGWDSLSGKPAGSKAPTKATKTTKTTTKTTKASQKHAEEVTASPQTAPKRYPLEQEDGDRRRSKRTRKSPK